MKTDCIEKGNRTRVPLSVKWCQNIAIRFFISEFFGTAFMTIIITCTACQVTLSRGQSGNMVSGFFGTIFGVMFAVYVSIKGSGGHINPIVSLVMVLIGQTHKRHLIVYWIAQYVGAFLGAGIAYGIYAEAFNTFDGGNRTLFGEVGTGLIFSSFPQSEDTTLLTCVFDQLLSTSVLIIGILTIIDPVNMQLPIHLIPPAAGLLIGMVIACLGRNCLAPLNPAKDFSSRLLMAISGWGAEPFSYRGYTWWYVPLLVPHVGAFLGWIVYRTFVKSVLVPPSDTVTEIEELEEKIPRTPETVKTKLLNSDPGEFISS